MRRRVVITGLGVVSGYGVGVGPFWRGLAEGRSTIRPIERFDASGFASKHAAEVPDFSGKDHMPRHYRKAVKVMARDSELAVAAAASGVQDAGLVTRAAEEGEPTYPGRRVGCQIGAGLIAADVNELAGAMVTSAGDSGEMSWRRWGAVAESGGDGAMNNLPPLWLLKYLPNMLACHVTIIHGCEGPSNTILAGEAAGLLSIGEGSRIIERNDADATLSGGIESKLNLTSFIRLHLAGLLAPSAPDDSPSVAPYDQDSPGTFAGEGGAVIVLEERGSASARGASPYAELLGFGAGQETVGLGSLGEPTPEEGVGGAYAAAIRAALADASCDADEIDAIVPGALGHAESDARELAALRRVFADRLGQIPIIATPPLAGACAAGASGLQIAAGALALRDQRLPAHLLLGGDRKGLTPESAREARLSRVLVCVCSTAGQCVAAVLAFAG